jgi:hypothetical protein
VKADPDTITLSGFASGGEIEVPCDRIDASLDKLWRGIAAKAAQGRGDPVHRACLLNLVIHSGDATSEVVSRFLSASLTARFPARIVLVRARPGEPGPGAPRAFVAASSSPEDDAHGPRVAGELVLIDARGPQTDVVPAVLRASLEPDVTTTLWWTGPLPPRARYVTALRDLADRVVVDSESLPDDADVSHVLPPASSAARVADLAWPRLAPWRTALARAFDDPTHRPFLRGLSAVTIAIGARKGEACEASAAPLLAGWLAAALGWRDCARGAGRAVCFTRGDGSVTVTFEKRPSRHAGLLEVALASGADAVRIRRTDASVLEIDCPSGFRPCRATPLREPDPADVLGATLLDSSSDPIAPAAIRLAAEIAAALAQSGG